MHDREMKICPKCNKKLEQGTNCPQCGEPLRDVGENAGSNAGKENPIPARRSVEMKKPSAAKYVILSMAVVLCCLVAAVMIYKKAQTVTPAIEEVETDHLLADILSKAVAVMSKDEEHGSEEEAADNQENPDSSTVEEVIPPESETAEPDYEAYILPESNSRYLGREDIEHLSQEELRLARNEIYARHGRMFDDTALQEYFNSKDWYSGTIAPSDFAESVLNDYEMQNAYLITQYEEEMGYY